MKGVKTPVVTTGKDRKVCARELLSFLHSYELFSYVLVLLTNKQVEFAVYFLFSEISLYTYMAIMLHEKLNIIFISSKFF